MRLVHVQHHEIGLLARLQRADLIVEPQCLRGIDGDHLQDLSGRKEEPVVVEQRVLERLIGQLDAAKMVEMSEHVARERIANNSNNQREIIKLSGGFHVMLAEMAEAEFLCSLMRDLVSRTSLISAAFRDSNQHNCGPD